MPTTWQLTFKPTFLHELTALESKLSAQILKKLDLLTQDPRPDAKTKKQLTHLDGKLHRLRSGDYRIFYTFEEPFVSLLSIKRRDEQTYETDVDAESLGGLSIPETPDLTKEKTNGNQDWSVWLGRSSKATALAQDITAELLNTLKVPGKYHGVLLKVSTEDELLDCPVPQDILVKVIDAVTGRPLELVAQQPDLILNDPEDLLRFREGELLGFLLRLEPEQEKLASWALSAKGATLLKGGPGTGKSTVALYRVKEILANLRKAKIAEPKILFSTYTRALTRASEQLLRSLVGPEGMKFIEVRTADSVISRIALDGGVSPSWPQDVRRSLVRALEEVHLQGSALKIASQKSALSKMNKDFLLEEINIIIEGRGLNTLEEYLETPRPGRHTSLTKVQREAVWRVREAFVAQLTKEGVATWETRRRRAAERVKAGEVPACYDAVLIDEAQDLSPTAISTLVGLCKSAKGVFLTADANQSIYGAGFRWAEIHEWLKFQGRTAVLRANHRSTKEIGEASVAYLRSGQESELDDEPIEATYVHSGAIPAVRAVEDGEEESKLLARFFRQATRALKLGLGGCAVLTPTNDAASQIAEALNNQGLAAKKLNADELDLLDPGVKVLTLKNAKGLEFPIVAMAGFSGTRFPFLPAQATEEETSEILARERRTMFVAMTRAMRALLVVIPSETDSPLLQGFAAPSWNNGREEST